MLAQVLRWQSQKMLFHRLPERIELGSLISHDSARTSYEAEFKHSIIQQPASTCKSRKPGVLGDETLMTT
jgi:hypothetical protein